MSSTPTPAERLTQAGIERMREHFDPQAGMVMHQTDTGTYHPTRESLGYAYALVIAEGGAALPEAERIIRRTLRDQERQPGNIHRGGFKWMDEDQGVTDLNAVQFALEQLLPFYQDYADDLSPEFRDELLACFRLAAEELERLAVNVSYTNITLLDTLNTALLAAILDDGDLAKRARRRLDEWIAFTCRSGAVPEYNSPTYAAVDLGALAELAARASDAELRIKAQIMEERLWLHTATHYHPPTAQLAGPHSRAYHNDVTGGLCGIKQTLFRALGDERLLRRSAYATQRQSFGSVRAGRLGYHIPAPVEQIMREKPPRYCVQETADVDSGIDLTTFMTATYALGSASAGAGAQNDRVLLYYRRGADDDLGVLFSRYIINEHSFGSHFHATDRSTANNLNEEGQYWGAQHESRCIALYGLQMQTEPIHSLKTEVYLLDADRVGAIWVNGELAGPLPRQLSPHDAVLIEDGATYIAVRPLAPTRLGYEAPIILQERAGELVISIYNYYQGEPKRFWEYALLSGPFYKQNIRAGFILEVGDEAEHGDFAAFRDHILRGSIEDLSEGSVRRVRYASGGDLLEIAVDLRANRLVERRVNGALYQPPMLESPSARQSGDGQVSVGGATLRAAPAAWLVADPQRAQWLAASPALEPTPLDLDTPAAHVSSARFGFGRIAIAGGPSPEIDIIAARQHAPLCIQCAGAPKLRWNGRDVTAECRYRADRGQYVLPIGDRGEG